MYLGEVDFAATANAVAGANVSGVSINCNSCSSTVSSAAQSNITSVGTLSSLSVTANVSAGNVLGTGGVFTYVSGDGANLTAITGQNVSGEVDFAQVANSVAGANVQWYCIKCNKCNNSNYIRNCNNCGSTKHHKH